MLATGLGACSQELDHNETLVLFVIYFVLKMFKHIDFYIKQDCTRGVRVFFPMLFVNAHVSKNVI